MNKNVKTRIEQSVKESWDFQKENLIKELNSVTGRIEDILKLEDHRRNGHKSDNLEKSFGSLGSLTVNTKNLASILTKSDQTITLDKSRLTRVADIAKELDDVRQNNDFSFLLFHFDNNSAEIIAKAEEHLNQQAKVFRALRIGRLEAKAKYNSSLHDSFFSDFNWSHLDDDELALCSPVVVLLDTNKSFEEQFVELFPLLSSGLPIKMFAIQDSIASRSLPESSRAAVSSSSINVELLPLALQKVFVFQSVFSDQQFDDVLSRGLTSTAPGFFSILCADKDSEELAVSSRSFPSFTYDPGTSADFVTRIDLKGNAQLDSLWATTDLHYIASDGAETTLQIEQTFADYLMHELGTEKEFSTLKTNGKGNDAVLPLAKYLRLSADERSGKVPVVYHVKKDKTLERLIPSRNVILQSAEKMDTWHSLREMTGIENPLMQKSTQSLEEKLQSEKEQALQSLRSELETKSKERESQAVAVAMQNLSLRLFGMTGEADVANLVATTSSPAPAPAATQVSAAVEESAEADDDEVSEFAWIESNLCTTCDECTDLNNKIFAYDDKKLAYIKDPKGGPFKDIVKAADLCPANIIHPGTPQDPKEKNLEKLIKEAEPYQ